MKFSKDYKEIFLRPRKKKERKPNYLVTKIKLKEKKKTKRRGALTHGIMLLWYRNKQGCDGMSTEITFIK